MTAYPPSGLDWISWAFSWIAAGAVIAVTVTSPAAGFQAQGYLLCASALAISAGLSFSAAIGNAPSPHLTGWPPVRR